MRPITLASTPAKWMNGFDKLPRHYEKGEGHLITTYIERKAVLEFIDSLLQNQSQIRRIELEKAIQDMEIQVLKKDAQTNEVIEKTIFVNGDKVKYELVLPTPIL